jgi:uncharacterized membrane protein
MPIGDRKATDMRHIQDHVDLIAKHEQDFLAQRTRTERLGDSIAALAGSIGFVAVHLLVFLVWIGVNLYPGRTHFDPAPFSLLGTMVALEGILLASFILMRQARLGRRADERDHLMLQVLLLAEKEVTAVLKLDRQIAQHIGLERIANSDEARTLSQETSIDDVAQTIKDSLESVEE